MSASCGGGSPRNEPMSSEVSQRLRKRAVRHPLRRRSITSFKLPIQVNKGPVYLPFVDFHPSLDAWHYIFVDLRDDTLRPYVNSVVAAVLIGFGVSPPLAIVVAAACFALLVGAVGHRFKRALSNRDIAFWMISQRILPPVAVVIPIYVLFQHVGLLDTRTALVITYA